MLTAIAKPFGWLMMRLYEFTGNYGLAVILFALIVKLILLPFQLKSKRSMIQQQRLNPQVQAIQKRHAANQQKMNEEIQKLYKEEGVNPMSGCFWSLIPFPILIALYQAIRFPITIMMGIANTVLEEGGVIAGFLQSVGFESTVSQYYAQIEQSKFLSENYTAFQDFVSSHTGLISTGIEKFRTIDYSFLGLDLSRTPTFKWIFSAESWTSPSVWWPLLGMFLIPVVAAVLTFLQTKVGMATQPQPNQGDTPKSMNFMTYLGPLMTLYFAFIVPGSMGIYWIASSVFAIAQDLILNKHFQKKYAAEDAEFIARMEAREKRLEEKRQETERLKAEGNTERNANTSSKKKRTAEREVQREKAREYEKKKNKESTEVPASQVGQRRYARGRAYDPDRYADNGVAGAVDNEDTLADQLPDEVEEPVSGPEASTFTVEEPAEQAVAYGETLIDESDDADEDEDVYEDEEPEDTEEEDDA